MTRIAILLLAFVLLGFTYSATTPVFEAPDEVWHYAYLRYAAEGHGLPSLSNNDHGAYQEAAQPPLYYVVAALITAHVHDDDQSALMWHNPGFGYQAPGTVNDNKNMLIHTGREGWPWHNFTLALHLARLVSLAFGALAVWATWRLACEALPHRPGLALAAAGMVAFTPQFAFLSGVASNDSAAAALSTAALWSIVRLYHHSTARRAALTGALIGLAWLTKTSTLLLLPLALILNFRFQISDFKLNSLLSTLHAPRSIFQSLISNLKYLIPNIRHLVILTGTTLLTGGWWYARNLILYGDALGLSAHVNTPWGRPQPVSLAAILPELPKVYRSFWAAFGWGGIEAPAWIYAALGLLLFISLMGWLLVTGYSLLVTRHSPLSTFHFPLSTLHSPLFTILLVWCLAVLAALLRWMTQVEAPHGRLLFPAIGAWAVLLVAGWTAWGRPVSRILTLSSLSFLGALALLAPFAIIRPALLPPPLLTEAQVHAQTDERKMVYADVAELVGVRMDTTAACPGDTVPVTLCWQALQPMTYDYSVFVHFLGQDNLVVGARDTWPGLGRFPTSLWPPGRPFCDVVRVQIEPWTPAPAVYAVEVGLYDAKGGVRLELADSSVPIAGRLVVRGAPPPAPQHSTAYDLDSKITLIGYDAPAQIQAGQPFSLTLHWQAQTAPLEDYTVFVHVIGETGQTVAQSDAWPRNKSYPTSAWAKGEIVADTYTFTLPEGLYTFSVGMYHQPDEARLPVRDPNGSVLDNVIPLATVQVTR